MQYASTTSTERSRPPHKWTSSSRRRPSPCRWPTSRCDAVLALRGTVRRANTTWEATVSSCQSWCPEYYYYYVRKVFLGQRAVMMVKPVASRGCGYFLKFKNRLDKFWQIYAYWKHGLTSPSLDRYKYKCKLHTFLAVSDNWSDTTKELRDICMFCSVGKAHNSTSNMWFEIKIKNCLSEIDAEKVKKIKITAEKIKIKYHYDRYCIFVKIIKFLMSSLIIQSIIKLCK